MPKGIPAAGTRKPGGGRKPVGDAPLVRVAVYLLPDQAAQLRALGNGNASAAVRRLLSITPPVVARA